MQVSKHLSIWQLTIVCEWVSEWWGIFSILKGADFLGSCYWISFSPEWAVIIKPKQFETRQFYDQTEIFRKIFFCRNASFTCHGHWRHSFFNPFPFRTVTTRMIEAIFSAFMQWKWGRNEKGANFRENSDRTSDWCIFLELPVLKVRLHLNLKFRLDGLYSPRRWSCFFVILLKMRLCLFPTDLKSMFVQISNKPALVIM